MKLIKKSILTTTLTLRSGLHIGGTNSALNIGGPDNFVIRNPITNQPYIPGSSLKGKMRSLIELRDGTIGRRNGPTEDPNTNAGALFGISAGETGRASRLIVRDATLADDFRDATADVYRNTDMPFTESKTEANIDRITSAANPRTYERVPAGVVFNVEMVLNVFDQDNKTEAEFKQIVADAIHLLEDDYLGGSGSRGYGQIEFGPLHWEDKDL